MTKHTYLSEPFDLVLDRLGLSLVTLGHLPLGLYLCRTPIPCTIISVSITIALLISIVQCRRDWLGLALNLGRWLGFVGSNLMLLLLAGVVLIVGINWPLRLFHEGCPASAFATHSCAISRSEAVERKKNGDEMGTSDTDLFEPKKAQPRIHTSRKMDALHHMTPLVRVLATRRGGRSLRSVK